ncbi:MAG: sugar phosphate isomerase/epimerase family protein [Chitinophagaceae bacterium]
MNYKRRDFLQMSGSMAAALTLAPLTRSLLMNDELAELRKKQKTFGLQLYSLRDDMPKDPKGILKQVASFGYKQVEGYEGPQGMFWGMGNTDFKKYMDDLGMEFITSHCNIDKDFEKKAADAAAIGMKYLICPSRGSYKTVDDFKKVAADFNLKGEICKKNGIRFAYHNHEYSFKETDGQYPQDIMMMNTDPAIVDYEMDIYWVVTGNQDPIVWLNKYPNRFVLGHVKDRIKGATDRGASCILGTGSIDYPKIVKAAKHNGMKYFIVEHERYDNSTPLKCVEADAEYMKKLKI